MKQSTCQHFEGAPCISASLPSCRPCQLLLKSHHTQNHNPTNGLHNTRSASMLRITHLLYSTAVGCGSTKPDMYVRCKLHGTQLQIATLHRHSTVQHGSSL